MFLYARKGGWKRGWGERWKGESWGGVETQNPLISEHDDCRFGTISLGFEGVVKTSNDGFFAEKKIP